MKEKYINTNKTRPIQATSKPMIRDYVKPVIEAIRRFFNNIIAKVENLFKKPKKQTKAQKKLAKEKRKRGILGVGLLLVIVSIAYSTTVTCILTNNSPAAIVILIPQVAFAVYISHKAFSNLYK